MLPSEMRELLKKNLEQNEICIAAVFYEDFCTKFDPLIDFLDGDLHIIDFIIKKLNLFQISKFLRFKMI